MDQIYRGLTQRQIKGKDYLLLIGIDEYAEWPNLNNAVRDAKALKKVLLERYGFQEKTDNGEQLVYELYDEAATREKILAAIDLLVDKVGQHDRLLLFFSGHGYKKKTGSGEGYLITTEITELPDDRGIIRKKRNLLSYSELRDALGDVHCQHLLLIADACYAGKMLSGGYRSGERVQTETPEKYRLLESTPSMWGMFSGTDRVLDGSQGGNSPFATALLSELKKATLPFSSKELFASLEKEAVNNYRKAKMSHLKGVKPVEGAILGPTDDGRIKHPAEQGRYIFFTQLTETQAWAAAEAQNTPDAYKLYLKQYPNSQHIAEATWRSYGKRPTVKQAQAFLKAFPNARDANAARRILEAEAETQWQNLLQSFEHTQNYLNGGVSLNTAQQDALWERVQEWDTKEAYLLFFEHCAEHPSAEFALWSWVLLQKTVDAYREYLDEYPKGLFRSKARKDRNKLLNRERYKSFADRLELAALKGTLDDGQKLVLKQQLEKLYQKGFEPPLADLEKYWTLNPIEEKKKEEKSQDKETKEKATSTSKHVPKAIQELEANMVFVEGGTFTMGCTSEQGSDCFGNEKPAHEVTLSSYHIGKYPVTQAQWEAVMDSNPSYFGGEPNHPVEGVSWKDCQHFILKLNEMTGENYRLPTEAEWEYAARGGQKSVGYKYAGSDDLGEVAWYEDNSENQTHEVGQKQDNELGLYDMSGNVWEWCQDWYGPYSKEQKESPKRPSSGKSRVLRGGSWYYNARACRVSFRSYSSPAFRNNIIGFRLVLP